MTRTEEPASGPPRRTVRRILRGRSELGVCALLLAVGVLVLTDALTMDMVSAQRGPVGPKTVPVAVGCALLLVAAVLAVDVLRGGAGETEGSAPGGDGQEGGPESDEAGAADSGPEHGAEEGRDDEPASAAVAEEPADWRTVALLAGIFLAFAALIEPLGFPLSGALLFWGSAYTLGSRNFTRDPLIAAALSLAAYAAFNTLLGVPLPGGPLMGVI